VNSRLRAALEARLGAKLGSVARVTGGDINEAYSAELDGGRRVFVKTHASAPPSLFPAEARGLEWLRGRSELHVPEVLAVSKPGDELSYLVLEWLESASPARDFDERLGRGLAELHRAAVPGFGLDHDNFIGSLPQSNQPRESWVAFFREQRLEPQLERLAAARRASFSLRRSFERLFERLPELWGEAEPPARLHGDLWGGNLHVGARGEPCLIDPAVYGGHREIDLGMMRLFGGFSERVFQAYDEAFPLSPGATERLALCQLYPLLVHANLFGGSYVGSVERLVARYT
jgi:protein-ribulosamine 3-kinase